MSHATLSVFGRCLGALRRSARRRRAAACTTFALGVLALAALGLVGCVPELPSPSLIDRLRVIGARAEVVAEPNRASPKPGETVRVRWNVAFPGPPDATAWFFTACLRAPALQGQPSCLGNPIGFVAQLDPIQGEPTLYFVVPDAAALGGADSVLVAGSICAGTLNLNPKKTEACANSGDAGQLAVFTVPIDLGQSNWSPTIDAVTLDGAAWIEDAPTDAPRTGCSSLAGIPQRKTSTTDVPLTMSVPAISHEPYTALQGDPPTPTPLVENIQVSHMTTAGYLEGLYTTLDPTQLVAQVAWTLPPADQLDPSGTLARLHFVVRDLRGGVFWQRRSVCLLP